MFIERQSYDSSQQHHRYCSTTSPSKSFPLKKKKKSLFFLTSHDYPSFKAVSFILAGSIYSVSLTGTFVKSMAGFNQQLTADINQNKLCCLSHHLCHDRSHFYLFFPGNLFLGQASPGRIKGEDSFALSHRYEGIGTERHVNPLFPPT